MAAPPFRLEIPPCPPEQAAALARELGCSSALAQVLVRRGLCEPGAARAFLAAGERHPPQAFAGIEHAAEVIVRALLARELITVHGDYDVDGVTSTAILLRALRTLGGEVDHYIPDRAEGYGLAADTVRRLHARGTRLLITADCAITAVDEVALARELGMGVVVSDHHTPRADGALPEAPIVHPAICGYPCTDLCAAAVAHKLAEVVIAAAAAAGADEGRVREAREQLAGDLDLVALATIADLVPLLGENRRLAREGLRALARTTKPGLRALCAVAGLGGAPGEREVAFALAPRLNAAGRLYRADAALELLLTADAERAARVAEELDRANRERRRVELEIRREAEAQLRGQGERSAYVLAGEGWHHGVIGIVASRMVEASGRPVVMVALEGDTGRGSGRSVEGFDLLAGLSACGEHLERFGGHRAAAGLEVARSQVPAFAAALDAHAASVPAAADPRPVEHVDAVVGVGELTMELAEELARLAPFGRGNPSPSVMVSPARFEDVRPMGEGRHARFSVCDGRARARAVAFGCGGDPGVEEGREAEATFTLEVNEWNGVCEPRLVLRRARPAAAPEGPPAGLAAPPARTPPPAPIPEPSGPLRVRDRRTRPEPRRQLELFAPD